MVWNGDGFKWSDFGLISNARGVSAFATSYKLIKRYWGSGFPFDCNLRIFTTNKTGKRSNMFENGFVVQKAEETMDHLYLNNVGSRGVPSFLFIVFRGWRQHECPKSMIVRLTVVMWRGLEALEVGNEVHIRRAQSYFWWCWHAST